MNPFAASTPLLPTPPPEAWPEFNSLEDVIPVCKKEYVGRNPRGIRWSLWPLCFERYVSDTEPDLITSDQGNLTYNRIVIWNRPTRTDTPSGWHSISKYPWRTDGFHILHTHYRSLWSSSARRHLQKWNRYCESEGYRIEEISLEEYVEAYKKSTIWKKMGNEFLGTLVRKYKNPISRAHITLWGARSKQGDVVAGLGAIHSPTHKASVFQRPFMLPQAKELQAMTGLIDCWCTDSLKKNIDVLWFTDFWQPGRSQSWKGFSEFKSQFGLTFVSYPQELIRFKKGKIF